MWRQRERTFRGRIRQRRYSFYLRAVGPGQGEGVVDRLALSLRGGHRAESEEYAGFSPQGGAAGRLDPYNCGRPCLCEFPHPLRPETGWSLQTLCDRGGFIEGWRDRLVWQGRQHAYRRFQPAGKLEYCNLRFKPGLPKEGIDPSVPDLRSLPGDGGNGTGIIPGNPDNPDPGDPDNPDPDDAFRVCFLRNYSYRLRGDYEKLTTMSYVLQVSVNPNWEGDVNLPLQK